MKKIILLSLLVPLLSVHAQTWSNATLDINQVETIINSNGDLFWDYQNGHYEVPNDSGASTVFAAATWIGGLDTSGTLHLAAQTYRQSGNDFYPGPVMYTSSYSPATDAFWNQVWKINKTTIDSFVIWFANPGSIPG